MPLVIVCAGLAIRVASGRSPDASCPVEHDRRHREGCAVGLLICSCTFPRDDLP